MNRLRVVCMLSLLAGLWGRATAQSGDLGTSPASPVTYGQSVALVAHLYGDPNCGGYLVQFWDSGTELGNFPNAVLTVPVPPYVCMATAEVTPILPAGTHNLVAYWVTSDDRQVIATFHDTLVVNIAPANFTLMASPNPSTVGQSVTVTANVSPSGATGNVDFVDYSNNTLLGGAGISNGVASLTTAALAPGSHVLTLGYSGDPNYAAGSVNSVTQTVNKISTAMSLQSTPASSPVGQVVALTATVSPSTATGTVTFKDGATAIGTVGLSGGTASSSTSSLSIGSHSLTASYSGDANDSASVSSTITETVSQIVTTTSLQASPTSSTPGQTVVLTATVSPSTATGMVSFQEGVALLGAAQLNAGTASISTFTLSVGNHSLTASYSGDTNDSPSTSPAVTESVAQHAATPTAITLAASPNPSIPGQNVTLTATVAPTTATGTVSFFDGATLLGNGPLTAGAATFSTSTLSTATHSLTASYPGDANNAPSTSAAVNQSVTAATGRTITSLVPATAAVGSASFTLTVNGTGFSSGAVVEWNGAPLGTTFVSATQVTASIPANLLASPAMVTITVVTTGGTAGGATFQVTSSGQPAPGSVTPPSGIGSAQSYAFQFSDPAGYQSLGVVNVLINNFLDGRTACYLAYVVPSNTLVLVDDGGDAGGPYAGSVALGNAGAIQNSQCAVTLVSAIGSGSTLTLLLNIAFKPAFGGNRIVYMAARDMGAGNSNWQALGVWQVTYTPAGTIVVTGVTPGRGAEPSATGQEFFVTVTDSKGTADFGVIDLLINNFIDGRQACYLAYVASTNALILLDDPGDAAGPYAGSMALNGGAGSIQNSQCTVSGAGSAVSSVSNTLTLTLNITFKSAFTGNRVVYAAGRDGAGANNTDWQALATWTVQ